MNFAKSQHKKKKKLIKDICRGDSATKRGRDSSVGIREEANQYQYIYQYQSVCLAVGASLPQAVDRAAFPSYQNISTVLAVPLESGPNMSDPVFTGSVSVFLLVD